MINNLKKLPSQLYRRYILYTQLLPYARRNKGKKVFNSKDTIAVFSSPRGGSTWLGELLATLPNSSLVYEPLFRGFINTNNVMPDKWQVKTQYVKDLNFYFYQPIPEEGSWPEAQEFLFKLFNRELVTLSMYHENVWTDIPKSEHFIFKFCTAELMLPWIVNNFDISPILLVRHPCAVVASQLQHIGWNNVRRDPKIKIPDFKFNDIYLKYQDLFNQIKTPEENCAAFWAIKTLHTVGHPDNNKKWITVSYEKLYADSINEVPRIFKRLNKEVPEKVWQKLDKPSRSSTASSLNNLNEGNQLASWRKSLTHNQIDKILRTIQKFGIDFYDDSLEPDYSKVYRGSF